LARPDHIRVLTVHKVSEDDDPTVAYDVELCPEARVYSYTLCGEYRTEPERDPPELVAVWKLQDSQLELWSNCCSVRADLPGLAFPASSKLVIPSGVKVTLTITYGQCSP